MRTLLLLILFPWWSIALHGQINFTGAVDWLQAEEQAASALAHTPADSTAWEQLALICLETCRFEDAEIAFENADQCRGLLVEQTDNAEIISMVSENPPFRLPQVETRYNLPEMEDQVRHFPDSTALLMALADAYAALGNPQKARPLFRRVIALDPDHPEVYKNYGLMAQKAGWLAETEPLLFQWAKMTPDTPDASYAIANLFMTWQRWLDAEVRYRDIINRFPQEIRAYEALFALLEARGRYDDADYILQSESRLTNIDAFLEAFYDRMIARYPNNARWRLKGGLLQERTIGNYPDTSRIEKGIRLLKSALHLDPAQPGLGGIWQSIGNLESAADSLANAAAAYEQAMAYDTVNLSIALDFIETCDAIHAHHKALNAMRRLYDQKRMTYSLRVMLIDYTIRAGQLEEGRRLLEEGAWIFPAESPEFDRLYAILNQKQGRLEESKKFWEKLQEYPNGSEMPWWRLGARWGSINPDPNTKLYAGHAGRDSLSQAEFAMLNYAAARVDMLLNQPEIALAGLEKALKTGFPYPRVFRRDPVWAALRHHPEWIELCNKYPMP